MNQIVLLMGVAGMVTSTAASAALWFISERRKPTHLSGLPVRRRAQAAAPPAVATEKAERVALTASGR
jgi:hypothetical protein